LLWAIRRHYPPLTPQRGILAGIIFFAFGPLMLRCLMLGQTTPIMVLLFALAYLSARAGWTRTGGGLLGLICSIKIPPILIVGLLASRRRLSLVVSIAMSLSYAAVALLLVWRVRDFVWPSALPRDTDPASNTLDFELALGTLLMLLLFPVVWLHYYLFLVVPLALLPFWWESRGLRWRPATLVLGISGTILAGGFPVQENAYYVAREGEWLFRQLQSARLLGALLLLAALLRELPRAMRAAPPRQASRSTS
jgi:hypothetical protein